tara:strand:+ start:1631 stop:1936 length:306 start_codon:yes stop_codon:yes gene_type:complete
MKKIKYATIPILEKLVEQAERADKNQYPDMYKINETISELELDHETVKFPIVMTLDHNDIEVRAVFNIPNVDEPTVMDRFLLDMEYQDYNELPAVEVSDEF